METGSIIAERLRLTFTTAEALREHDRRAVGFLSREKFTARVHDLFAHPDEVVFGNESASAALARFAATVDHLVVEDSGGDIVVVSHGTVISLFVAKRADVDGEKLWATLGLPSYVSLELPNHRIVEIVATI